MDVHVQSKCSVHMVVSNLSPVIGIEYAGVRMWMRA